ncbi:unnamed protein product [Hymenolepis diminuta]|uniref:SAC3/GANP/THP3 conserved domain-containing protein n=1 Tax=Hymenolepis diminuta TaxID=6216 RepID=A0A564Y7I7_HYMDI|nr:unnamed protein product [Hymenolepis diminuta]
MSDLSSASHRKSSEPKSIELNCNITKQKSVGLCGDSLRNSIYGGTRNDASNFGGQTEALSEKRDHKLVLELDNIEISPMSGSRRGGHYNLSPTDRNRLVICDRLSSEKPSAGFCIADMTRCIDLKSDSKDQRVTIVGTMQELEKPYLRLSKTPDPSEVRPPEVLQLSLYHVLKLWKNGERKYAWVSSQFKSMRQDLVIQRIYSDLAIEIYESSAKVAIDAHDPLEFNQCQSQLLSLYSAGVSWPHRLEFTAYRILYYIYIEDIQGLNLLFMRLKPSEKENPFIQFALKAYEAWSQHNYKRLFDLANRSEFEEGEKCKRLLSWLLPRERQHAVRAIFKSYRQTLNMKFVAKALGFADTLSCESFFTDTMKITLDLLKPSDNINCKEAWLKLNHDHVTA